MAVKHIPEGYHSVTPYLVVTGVIGLIGFMKSAFDATEIERIPAPNGAIAHAEVRIGDSMVMMVEPRGVYKPMPASLYIYVRDTDAVYQLAINAGGTSILEPVDQFYGDRNAGVRDPSGNHWWIATRKEDLSPEELMKRAQAIGR